MCLVYYELKKLIGCRSFILIVAACLALNCFSAIRNIKNRSISPKEYREFYSETNDMTNAEISEYISDNLELSFNGTGKYSTSFICSVRDRFCYIESYPQYLKNIEDRCDSITHFSLFASRDSFSYKNAERTRNAYSNIQTKELPFEVSEGAELVLVNRISDIILIFLIFSAAVFIFTKDRENGIHGLLTACPNGRSRLCAAKLETLFCISIILNILFLIENLIIGAATYGIGDISRPLQSVSGFMECRYNITVGQYIAVSLLYKIFGCFLWGCIFALICILSVNSFSIYIFSALTAYSEIYLYNNFSFDSDRGLLHDLNIVNFIKPESIFASYRNLNFSGRPVYIASALALMYSVMIIVFTVLPLICFPLHRCRSYSHLPKILRTSRSEKIHGKMYYTLKKSLILQKSGRAVITWIATVILFHSSFTKPADLVDLYYKNYTDANSGAVTYQTDEVIRQDTAYFEDVNERISMPDLPFTEYKMLQKEIYRESAFEMFSERCGAVRDEKGAEIFYDSGYKRAFGITSTNDHLMISLLIMILCVIIISPLFAFDNNLNMRRIIYCTASGKAEYIRRNVTITLSVSTGASILTMIPYFCNIMRKYGAQGLHKPIQSMTRFADSSLHLSVLGYAVCLFISATLLFSICSLIMLAVSYKCRSRFTAMLINMAIFVLPVGVIMIHS